MPPRERELAAARDFGLLGILATTQSDPNSPTAAWGRPNSGADDVSAAGHLFVGLDETEPGYLAMAVTARECSGVTGACLATRRETFESHGRFDESLGVDLNDIDYCLRAQRAGLTVLYEAGAELIHHESPSRGFAGGGRDIMRFIDRWRASILAGDPYLSPNLTRIDSSCALRGGDEGEWWHRWYASISA